MNDQSVFVGVGIIFAIVIVVGVLVMWRMRKHVSSRAAAEARMAAAMQELQVLAARLEAQKRTLAAADAPPAEDRRDATPST
jgi:Na+-transporting methylmalonyl-CoA/oxaloacetate decarboxylase gamma subunit